MFFILSPPQLFQLGSGALGILAMTANEEEVHLVFPPATWDWKRWPLQWRRVERTRDG